MLQTTYYSTELCAPKSRLVDLKIIDLSDVEQLFVKTFAKHNKICTFVDIKANCADKLTKNENVISYLIAHTRSFAYFCKHFS